jgi:hypothetical protein
VPGEHQLGVPLKADEAVGVTRLRVGDVLPGLRAFLAADVTPTSSACTSSTATFLTVSESNRSQPAPTSVRSLRIVT